MADDQDKSVTKEQQKLGQLEAELAQAVKNKQKLDDKTAPTAKKSAAKSSGQSYASSSSTAKAASKTTGKGHALLWFFTLINLLLVASLAVAGYWFWLQWQNKDNSQQQRVSELQEANQQQQATNLIQQRQLTQQADEAATALQELRQQLQLLTQQSQATQQQITDLSGRRPADWLLAESDYLVKMAGRKLWLEHDINTAKLMLQAADSRLQDLADPSLLPIRQLLAEDLATLQQINPVSLSSVALSLSALVQQVNNLPLDTIKLPDPAEPQPDLQLSDDTADWQDNLAKTWKRVADYFFTVTRREAPVQPYMTAQQQWLAREQLKHSLMQAQMAVLREQPALYQQSLQLVLAALIEQFDMEEPSVEQFIASVQNLLDTKIERSYPSSFKVAEPLADLLNSRTSGVYVNGTVNGAAEL